MQRLPIHLLEPGMVVAREVLNEKAMILVNVGTELDENLILRMENMHVSMVVVQGCPVTLKEFQPKSLQQRIEDNDKAFSIHKNNAKMKQLRVLVKSHLLEKDRREREFDATLGAAESGARQPESDISEEQSPQEEGS